MCFQNSVVCFCYTVKIVESMQTYIGYTTGAQEWHIVSLIGDVTSPTTVANYVSMTSDLCVLCTEKH